MEFFGCLRHYQEFVLRVTTPLWSGGESKPECVQKKKMAPTLSQIKILHPYMYPDHQLLCVVLD